MKEDEIKNIIKEGYISGNPTLLDQLIYEEEMLGERNTRERFGSSMGR